MSVKSPVAAIPAEFRLVKAGPPEIGKGQRWEAVILEEGQTQADVFPVVMVYAFAGNAAANLIDMMRVAVRAELNARAKSAAARTKTKRKPR